MALNSTTGIDPEVDRFAIVQISSGNTLNLNATWPRFDGDAISGANPDLAFYKKVEAQPLTADHRYTISSTWSFEAFDPAVDPANGLPVGEYKQSRVANLLPVADLKAQVETAFQAELQKQFPNTSDPSVLIQAGGALARKSDGAQLTTDQAASVETIKAVEDVVRQLRALQAEKNTAIDNGDDYDIEDWSIS